MVTAMSCSGRAQGGQGAHRRQAWCPPRPAEIRSTRPPEAGRAVMAPIRRYKKPRACSSGRRRVDWWYHVDRTTCLVLGGLLLLIGALYEKEFCDSAPSSSRSSTLGITMRRFSVEFVRDLAVEQGAIVSRRGPRSTAAQVSRLLIARADLSRLGTRFRDAIRSRRDVGRSPSHHEQGSTPGRGSSEARADPRARCPHVTPPPSPSDTPIAAKTAKVTRVVSITTP